VTRLSKGESEFEVKKMFEPVEEMRPIEWRAWP